jgi:hypothetical protein
MDGWMDGFSLINQKIGKWIETTTVFGVFQGISK